MENTRQPAGSSVIISFPQIRGIPGCLLSLKLPLVIDTVQRTSERNDLAKGALPENRDFVVLMIDAEAVY